MKYVYNGITYNVPDNAIDKLMDSLDISLAEACETWLADNDKIKNEEAQELTAIADKNRITTTIHNAKGEKKTRKAPERKPNENKREIIKFLYDVLKSDFSNAQEIEITNEEKYIDFKMPDGKSYTINLVEHRPKDKSKKNR